MDDEHRQVIALLCALSKNSDTLEHRFHELAGQNFVAQPDGLCSVQHSLHAIELTGRVVRFGQAVGLEEECVTVLQMALLLSILDVIEQAHRQI